jgi:hypothetical protein
MTKFKNHTKRRSKGGRRFIQLWTNVKRSQAYHGLSWVALSALLELLDRYTGINNGMIVLSVRDLADDLNSCQDTAARALRELDDAGLAHPTQPGALKGRRAAEWRLTFYLCNKTGELPVTHWPERTSPGKYNFESRSNVRPIVHKQPLAYDPSYTNDLHCTTHRTQNRNSSINDPAHRTTHRTHIDIYQGDRGQGVGTTTQQKARLRAGIILEPAKGEADGA